MKILVASHVFYPDIGGLETVSRVLAEEFAALGHEVRVVTQSLARAPAPGVEEATFPFPVLRRPSPGELLAAVRWCDVFWQNNVSLQTLWPRLLARRPWVVTHQTWLTRVGGRVGWQDRLKKFLLRFGSNVAISRAVAAPLPVPATIIGNPYQSHQFRELSGVPRERDLVLLARLVSDKGGDLALDALAELRRGGLTPNLTIVGDGPERGALEQQARDLGVAAQVTFAGVQTGDALVETLNRHRIMVAPSRLAEPFGVVALEGIACGCVVVGSEDGGLIDAIGPCGLTFPNGDACALARCLARLLADPSLDAGLRGGAAAHLEKHSPRRIAQAYLRVFEEAGR